MKKVVPLVLCALGALVLALPLAAQSRFTFTPATPPLATAPLHGTFDSMQRQGVPPMPFNRFPALPVYEVAPGVYLVDDRSVDYAAQNAAMNLLQSVLSGGTATLIEGGIAPEDFDLIPPGKNLYCADAGGRVLMVAKEFFNDLRPAVLVTQAGNENGEGASLYVIRWAGNAFTCQEISPPDKSLRTFEHVTFAPLQLPVIPR